MRFVTGFRRISRLFARRSFRRGAMALLLIGNQIVLCTGLPLPALAQTPQKDRSQPFPCMDRPCGCQNADQCWHSCCCFSMQEKLAWAEAHHIEPPAYVREEAQREARASSAQRTTCCQCGSCARSSEHGTCPNCQASATQTQHTAATANQDRPDGKLPRPVGWVCWIMALGCQGQSGLAMLALSPALPAFRVSFFLDEPPLVESILIAAERPQFLRLPPPVPPPRGVIA